MKNVKASGLDGVKPEIIKIMCQNKHGYIEIGMNEPLVKPQFSDNMKKAKLILIPKLVSVQPICLLNTTRKLFDSLTKARLEKELDRKGLISGN